VTDSPWTFSGSDGRLTVKTDVTGRASRLGHRLTIAMNAWNATVTWTADEPATVDLNVDVDSLEVVRGEGGVTPLSGAEKALARSNALKALGAERFPAIRFRADEVVTAGGGYRLSGTLDIRGNTRPKSVDLGVEDLGDEWRLSCDVQVRQSEFGVKPYSMFVGAMKVADEVTVSFTGRRAKDR